jgi:hypothetical protein
MWLYRNNYKPEVIGFGPMKVIRKFAKDVLCVPLTEKNEKIVISVSNNFETFKQWVRDTYA